MNTLQSFLLYLFILLLLLLADYVCAEFNGVQLDRGFTESKVVKKIPHAAIFANNFSMYLSISISFGRENLQRLCKV